MNNLDDPVVRDFLKQFGERGLPKMMESAMCCVLGSDRPDPKLCLEIGAAILLDKPLILCLPRGRSISVNLRTCATAIVEVNPDGSMTEEQMDEFERAIERVIKHDPRVKQ
jgi:hypothetical protein